MTDGSRVRELLEDRPDLESPLAEILAVDEDTDSWTFDDIPVDSGVFGELVSRGVVESVGDEYRLDDPAAVRAALDEETAVVADQDTDQTAESEFSVSVPDLNARAVGMLVGALVAVVVVRSFVAGSVFRGEHVVLSGNDPYYYRYWVEQMLASGESLAELGGPVTGEPLMIVVLARLSALFGGGDAAGAVLAIYPVASAVICGILVYLFTERLAADRRVALASVVMLAITPGHALRTALGFADHHPLDYIWLMLTALAILVLVTEKRPRLADRTTALATIGVGVGVGGQVLAWDSSPLLLVPIAAVVAGHVLLAVRSDRSPLTAAGPIAVGLGFATVISVFGYVLLGWHSPAVASVPAVLFVGTVGVTAVGELVCRTGRSARELAAGETLVAVVVTAGVFQFVPDVQRRLLQGLGLIGRTDEIAEVRPLISGDTFGFLLLFGFLLVLALPMLVLMTRRAYHGSSSWLVACLYGWYFFVLALFQVRFVGQLALFTAVFAALGFVWLAAKVDLTRLPAPFADASRVDWTPARPDPSTVAAVLALFLLVGGLGIVQSGIKVTQVTPDDETYETAAWMAEYADEQGWESYTESYVLSRWGQNRLYNYFVNGESQSYGYAQSTYQRFITETDPRAASDMLADRVRFVVTADQQTTENVPPESMQARLHDALGSHNGNVEGVGQYRALYSSGTGQRKVFTPVPGARLTGRTTPNATIRVTTNVSIPTTGFSYERRVETTRSGIYDLIVPYGGEYTVGNETVDVSDRAVTQGQITGGFGGRGPYFWSFDEDGGSVAYDTDSGNHADLHQATRVGGHNGSGLTFNTSANGHTRARIVHNRTSEFTVSAWIRPETNKSGGILSTGNDGASRRTHGFLFDHGHSDWTPDRLGVYIGNGSVDTTTVSSPLDMTYPAESYTHVAVVFDEGNVTFYQNGSPTKRTDVNVKTVRFDTDRPLYIGREYSGAGGVNSFKGTIDGVRYSHRALSPDEIKQRYENTRS